MRGARADRRAHRLLSRLRHDFLAARALCLADRGGLTRRCRCPSPSRRSLRRIVAAAICLAFVLVPTSALSARSQGAAKARPATSAADEPQRDAAAERAAARRRRDPARLGPADEELRLRRARGRRRRRVAAGRLPCRAALPPRLDDQGRHLAGGARPARPAPPLAHERVRDRPGRRRAARRRPRHRRRPGRPDRQRAAPLVRADARRRAGDDRRQHRPRRRRAAARARPEAGARDRAGARSRRAHRRAHLQPRQAARLGEAGRAASAPW